MSVQDDSFAGKPTFRVAWRFEESLRFEVLGHVQVTTFLTCQHFRSGLLVVFVVSLSDQHLPDNNGQEL